MNIKKFAEKIAELHYPNKPNAIIDEPYRKVRMKTLVEQIEREFEILNLQNVSNNEVAVSCLNCHYEIAESYHDKMWCRDCKQHNHFKARTDC